MSDINLSSQNASTRRIYHRRNRTRIGPLTYIPVTTTFLPITTTTLQINSSSVPINDLFAPLSYLTQHNYIFLIGFSLLILLCVISIIFLVIILKCPTIQKRINRRQELKNIKRFQNIPDFLEDKHGNEEENVILLKSNGRTNSFTNQDKNAAGTNELLANDNISNTFSIEPMLVQKIIQNNPPNAISLSPAADDTSLDTLRGSLISSPSQQIPAIQSPPTPTHTTTTTDSLINSDEPEIEAEKDDVLHGVDLKYIPQRYRKAANTSSSNLPTHRTSGSSLEQSIRRQERRAEEEERIILHGSNSNLYEKELRQQAALARHPHTDSQASLDQPQLTNPPTSLGQKRHTNSQVSLVSRTSEDSCY